MYWKGFHRVNIFDTIICRCFIFHQWGYYIKYNYIPLRWDNCGCDTEVLTACWPRWACIVVLTCVCVSAPYCLHGGLCCVCPCLCSSFSSLCCGCGRRTDGGGDSLCPFQLWELNIKCLVTCMNAHKWDTLLAGNLHQLSTTLLRSH